MERGIIARIGVTFLHVGQTGKARWNSKGNCLVLGKNYVVGLFSVTLIEKDDQVTIATMRQKNSSSLILTKNFNIINKNL
jgi:hypothetical protein